jgi:putative flippase GtrA
MNSKMSLRSKLSKQFLIFASIGVLNTLIDVGLFLLLHDRAGLPIIAANIISTSAALGVSYTLNSKFTFDADNHLDKQRIGKFLAVTLAGLWFLQPAVIYASLSLIGLFIDSSAQPALAAAKLSAIPFTLAWNFVLYKKVVFARS